MLRPQGFRVALSLGGFSRGTHCNVLRSNTTLENLFQRALASPIVRKSKEQTIAKPTTCILSTHGWPSILTCFSDAPPRRPGFERLAGPSLLEKAKTLRSRHLTSPLLAGTKLRRAAGKWCVHLCSFLSRGKKYLIHLCVPSPFSALCAHCRHRVNTVTPVLKNRQCTWRIVTEVLHVSGIVSALSKPEPWNRSHLERVVVICPLPEPSTPSVHV